MAKDKSPKYNGELSAAQIATGMNAAFRNARRLADDAKLLLDAGRYPTAASIAVLSIEESGKNRVLRELACAPNKEAQRSAWKGYRLHRNKNVAWILPNLVAKGARDLDSLRPATDASAGHTALLDQIKQLGLYTDCYTDCLGDAHWSEPEKFVDSNMSRPLVELADMFARSEVVTVKEIELLVKHMRPAYGTSVEQMQTAFLDWDAAMRENNLLEDEDFPMEAFIRGDKEGELKRWFNLKTGRSG